MTRVLYITATLPALTVTFIYNEIFRLRKLGLHVDTVSMNTPLAEEISTEAAGLRDTTVYLDQAGFLSKLLGCVLTALLSVAGRCCGPGRAPPTATGWGTKSI